MATATPKESPRQVHCLDGIWEVAEGDDKNPPSGFPHSVPVPGLLDAATPPFERVGLADSRRKRFWYRRVFPVVEDPLPVALLTIHKAYYGTRVYLNGTCIGESHAAFTPVCLDVTRWLRWSGSLNELIIGVGAHPEEIPRGHPDGWQVEKVRYPPGLCDTVRLSASGTPHVLRAQVAPQIETSRARVQAVLQNVSKTSSQTVLHMSVKEAGSGTIRGEARQTIRLDPGERRTVVLEIPIQEMRLWSPGDPFLYRLTVDTGSDRWTTRFGMRTFHFDRATGRACLNGKPLFLRGTNITINRFYEDPACARLPWDRDWVQRLHEQFRGLHLNAMRYCIGFPPDFWYEVADETGFLIQDEFPIWYDGQEAVERADLQADVLVEQYSSWIHQRANHPSVVIWDAQNETVTPVTGEAICRVRHLDLSNRPWNNGWSPAQAYADVIEAHPYLISPYVGMELHEIAGVDKIPLHWSQENFYGNAVLINEYAWFWLHRDGTPTRLTRQTYERLFGTGLSAETCRELYAYFLAALTEKWRAMRKAAGVLYLCGLGYDIPEAVVCDNFIDVGRLVFEPNFERRMREAFAPVGVYLDLWEPSLEAGSRRVIPVIVVNDLGKPWEGRLRCVLERCADAGKALSETVEVLHVASYGRTRTEWPIEVPDIPGRFRLTAELAGQSGGEPVRSLREFTVPE